MVQRKLCRSVSLTLCPSPRLVYYYFMGILSSIKTNLVFIILGILALNILALDYFTFFTKPRSYRQIINVTNPSTGKTTTTTVNSIPDAAVNETPITAQTQPAANSDMCPNTCLSAIKTATSSLQLTQQVTNNTTQQVSGGAQEFFVPFGAGSGASQGTYATLGSLQAYVNMSQYTGVQTVTFEVSATIPNGNQSISIQLYDATDGYAIPNSQVTMSGGTPQLLISPNLTLPAGNKLYQVQVNTQLNSSITIDQARLHITTN